MPSEEAEEARQAFRDIVGWIRSADNLIGAIVLDAVRTARTPVDRARIDKLLEARAFLDIAEDHLLIVANAEKSADVRDDVVVRR